MDLREKILPAGDLAIEAVKIAEWGVTIYMHTLNGEQRDALEQRIINGRKGEKVDVLGVKVRMLIDCAYDERGGQIFQPSDVEELNKKSSRVISRLFAVAQRLSGITEAEAEEIAKNSAAAPSGGNGSDSP